MATMNVMLLAKEGFGTPEELLQMRADIVLDSLEYVRFTKDYERRFRELNP